MAENKVRIEDELGNVYYPHTKADVTFMSDGSTVEEKVTTHLDETKYETIARTIYVSVLSGNDDTGDGNVSKPFKTITKAISTVNKNIATTVTIRILAGDYRSEGNIFIKNYRGTYLMITAFDGTNEVTQPNDKYLVERITMYDSDVIYLQGLKCHPTGHQYGIFMSNCRYVNISGYKNEVTGTSGLGCTGNSFIDIKDSTASNLSTVISANHGTTVLSQNWINSLANDNGFVVDNGSKAHLYDDNQMSASNLYTQKNSGVIFDKNGDPLYSPQFAGATRDVSVAGVQTINVTGTPKLIRVRAFVNQTKKRSDGSWAKNGQGCTYVSGADGNLFDGTGWSVVIEDSGGNYTIGTITNVTKGSFDITWTKGGTGATGTVNLQFEVIYH